MSRALTFAALSVVAVVVTHNGGLDLSWAIGALRVGITLSAASSLALVALAGAALAAAAAKRPVSTTQLAWAALAAVAPSPAQLALAACLGAGASPAVVAGLGAAAVVGGAPDQLRGLGAPHAVAVVIGLVGLLSARGPFAPALLLAAASLTTPTLWTTAWGRVALISGGVAVGVAATLGAVLDRSRAMERLGWAWVGLGVAAMGLDAPTLGLTLGVAGLGVAALCAAEEPIGDAPPLWRLGLVALAAGVLPSLGLGGARDPLLALLSAGDPVAAAGVIGVSAATGACLGRAAPRRLVPAGVSLLAAPVIFGLARWMTPSFEAPHAPIQLAGLLAGALTFAAGAWVTRGGSLPERALPTPPRPRLPALTAPAVSAPQITRALAWVGLGLWALWALSAAVGGEAQWGR